MSVVTVIIVGIICLALGICFTYLIMNKIYKTKMINKEMLYWSIFENLIRKNKKSEQNSKAKSNYLASMVHDIRTPINTVIGMNEMILRENSDIEINEYANNIKRASNILVELVNDILDMSKIESGNMELVESSYDVCEVLNDVITMINDKCNRKNLRFEVGIDSRIPSILYGDENKIKQVVLNLLTNAVKYTQTGKVRFEVKVMKRNGADNVELFFSVEDTGTGIKRENLKSIFTSFRRIDEIKNNKVEGTGLGLNIVHHLLQLMNSKIEVKSEYGVGSKFYFLLTQKTIDNKPIGNYIDIYKSRIKNSNEYKAEFIAPDARILVVDDNEMNLLVASKLLKNTQMKVDTVSSGYGCLGKVNEYKYDAILMDIKMPELDGEETLKSIREGNSLNKHTPIIALTADAVAGVEQKYLDEGFDSYISKPIDASKLESSLEEFVKDKIVSRDLDVKIEEKDITEIIDNSKNLLSIDLGMSYCSNDKEMYEEILNTYKVTGQDNMDSIIKVFGDEDWTNYGIQIHSLKSSSLTVGAKRLSGLAKKLEEEINKGNIEYVKDNHEECMDMYRDTLEEIEEYFSKREN